jgi:predicted O-linked N-acetylglucosamine transferase (SPINDLY family)
MDDPGGPPSNKTLSMDRLRLHDGIGRQTSYVLRTVFLPGPQHIPLVALPRWLGFCYIPIGLAHDRIALPLYRAYEWIASRADEIGNSPSLAPVMLALKPMPAEAKNKLRDLQRKHATLQQRVTDDPANRNNWIALGDILTSMTRYKDAVEAYDRAAALAPDQRSIWLKRRKPVNALKKAGDWTNPTDAPLFDVTDASGWVVHAGFLSSSDRHMEAAQAADCALQIDPENEAAVRIGVSSRLLACDWSRRKQDNLAVQDGLAAGKAILSPFNLKLMLDSEEASFACANVWTKGLSGQAQPFWSGEHYRHDRIRVAYLSTDFRSHPVGVTIVAPLEHHDRDRFEVTAVSLFPPSTCDTHKRIKAAAERFVEAGSMEDGEISKMLRELEIDIAVDLNGLTGARRSRILMRRPAPLQANYLGFPGTTAMPFMDYVIADPALIPEDNRAFYSEKVAYLPHSYLPYDRQRRLADTPPSRKEEGLPETGFVFACFNRLNKVGPEIFAVWMRLLQAVEGSVLWIPKDDAAIMANLRREAAASGIAPERLIFAGYKQRIEDHLARQALADLFLDTLPYNAHSTASDALWAGLPVLTCRGQAFQARVAAGVLDAIGLPELITNSLDDYEALALALARDPQRLSAIREKLARNRDTTPLFDAVGFTRGLEAVYTTMWERQQAGLGPASFSIAS